MNDADIDDVLAAYLEAQSNGWAPDRQRLLRCYPHLAAQLERFLGNSDMVDAITVPLRAGVSASAQSTVADVQVHGEPRPAWPCVPGYEILGEIARGGMGVVYRARQLHADRVVALKMI